MRLQLLVTTIAIIGASIVAGCGTSGDRAGRASPPITVQAGRTTLSVDMASGSVREIGAAAADLDSANPYFEAFAASPDGRRFAFPCAADGSSTARGDKSNMCLRGIGDAVAGAPVVLAQDLARPGMVHGSFAGGLPAQWSPDGQRFVFQIRLRDAQRDTYPNDIYVFEMGVMRSTRVITNGGHEPYGNVTWSPDSTRFAIQRLFNDTPSDLVVVDAASGATVDVTAGLPAPVFVKTNFGWSADGASIAFTGSTKGAPYATSLYVASADGASVRAITDRVDYLSSTPGAWSPDGRWIAFSRDTRDDPNDPATPIIRSRLFAVHPDGSGLHAIGDNITMSEFPSWSPDSKLIAFTSEGGQDKGLFVVDAGGGNARLITATGVSYPWLLQWSADGTRIVYTAEGGCAKGGCTGGFLFLVPSDGKEPPRKLSELRIDRLLSPAR